MGQVYLKHEDYIHGKGMISALRNLKSGLRESKTEESR